MIMVITEPVFKQLSAALHEMYGVRLERVVLFSAHARGDARPDSDYDIAIFPNDYTDRWAEADRIADVTTTILEETGAFIHSIPYRSSQCIERSPLMHETRREGFEL